MKTLIALVLAGLLATGCASRREPASQIYDFGIAAAPAGVAADSVFVAEVRAADWLDTTDMFYRLAYRDPRALTPYAGSRWAGTPAALLTVRLRQSVGNGSATRNPQVKCVLALSLAEFSQVFESEASSRAVLHSQATLAEHVTAGRNMSREFRLERPTPTADAAGGAAAFSEIADSLSEELRAWIAEAAMCKK
ncbi:MAG: ABC-type transport auxiliary lipoprotein family protein [Betaproteobacteria bacterium]